MAEVNNWWFFFRIIKLMIILAALSVKQFMVSNRNQKQSINNSICGEKAQKVPDSCIVTESQLLMIPCSNPKCTKL